ncbi:hypothetical protein E2C01_031466 [Portunus trituberculatus]|uniref:Uncharacterized protein n=1 Tax=Portunus trituberculatus TaxID=210409 RepID=A0A5B7ETK2_PORTR|nr:hypothetical protein [Portunus trituberculatus]
MLLCTKSLKIMLLLHNPECTQCQGQLCHLGRHTKQGGLLFHLAGYPHERVSR